MGSSTIYMVTTTLHTTHLNPYQFRVLLKPGIMPNTVLDMSVASCIFSLQEQCKLVQSASCYQHTFQKAGMEQIG
jgi:hypothetical protein